MSKELPLVHSPKRRNTLVVRAAITAVAAEDRDLEVYEMIPIGAVIAGTMAATGNRAQNTALYLEVQVIDSNTGKPVIVVVRKASSWVYPINNPALHHTSVFVSS
ncbi:putative outer membrane lipoprotein [Yersinia enterocolitica]|nr:putative outer membrane lipoprotein [Yersinia enterocolitica]